MAVMVFSTLPQAVQALETDVAAAISGSVLGVAKQPTARINVIAKSALVVTYRYAPSAPCELIREAAIRCGGHMVGSRPHAKATKLKSPSGVETEIDFLVGVSGSSPLLASGAQDILSPYRVRRAGAISG